MERSVMSQQLTAGRGIHRPSGSQVHLFLPRGAHAPELSDRNALAVDERSLQVNFDCELSQKRRAKGR